MPSLQFKAKTSEFQWIFFKSVEITVYSRIYGSYYNFTSRTRSIDIFLPRCRARHVINAHFTIFHSTVQGTLAIRCNKHIEVQLLSFFVVAYRERDATCRAENDQVRKHLGRVINRLFFYFVRCWSTGRNSCRGAIDYWDEIFRQLKGRLLFNGYHVSVWRCVAASLTWSGETITASWSCCWNCQQASRNATSMSLSYMRSKPDFLSAQR